MLPQFLEDLRARLLTTSSLAQETSRDGQTLINNFFQSTVVDDTPAFVLANDFSRLLNFGEIVTNSAVAAVLAQGQDVDVFNFRSGRIEANSGLDALATGVQVTGSASVRNFGEIAGKFNGVQFAGAGSSGSLDNFRGGVISSNSRALNIDGDGLEVVNEGEILGTGNQRNGTVYADGTADNYSFTNTGLVDAGEGNNGSAVSLQTGDVSGDVVSAAVLNEGTLQGRGDAVEGNQVGDGLRLFTSQDDAAFAGVVVNEGLIAGSEDSDAAAGIRVDGGVNLLGAILNDGEIRGSVNAIEASDAGSVTIVNDDKGVINGNVLLGAGDDIFVDLGTTNGDIVGGAGDDVLIAGEADNVLTGGLGNDVIDGGDGIDTADFSDLDVAVEVSLDANGNGTATRDTGFTVTVTDAVVDDPDQFGSNIPDPSWFVEEAILGNLYYNIHTSDFPGGEIRGQLLVDSVETVNGIRTVTLSGGLDASQEPGPLSDSEATGQATVVITQNLNTGVVTYSSELSVVGLNEADLSTPIPGVVSAIHLHNAPAGQNGAVVQDTLVDAGATLDTQATGGAGVIGQDVIDNQIEVDVLRSIERVVGSDDSDTLDMSGFDGVTVDLDLSGPAPNAVGNGDEGPQDGAVIVDSQIVAEVDDFENVVGSSGDDLILGNNEFNVLDGGAGNDAIHSFGGADIIIGGEGIDTALFTAGPGVVLDLDEDGNGVATVNAPYGATLDQVFGFENINGSNNAGSPNGGNDILSGNSGANTLNGQAGGDVLNGEGGNDILIGGAGQDTFVFAGNFGDDVIQDFEVGIDQLQFGDFGPDFGGNVNVSQDGEDALISFGDAGSVLLAGVNSADLNEDDFVA
ncbi:beta strand repeat-containing protein [Ruegeria sp. MALMAid1280]|uniref:beta strand repeat-containing protein n=1 Tax=Ruegeria sp. MALMAid1280 TaxID=3411634 RepID=UPI003BA37B90